MKTTVFDLIWKLKREIENQGHGQIDLHKFTQDFNYRRDILLKVDIGTLPVSEELKAIYFDLLKDESLDLGKPVTLPTPNKTPEVANQSHDKKPWGLWLISATAIIAFAFFGWNFGLLDGFNSTPATTSSTVAQATVSQAATPAPVAKAPAPKPKSKPEAGNQRVAYTPEAEEKVLFRITGSNTVGEVLAPELIKAFYQSRGRQQVEVQKTDIDVENNIRVPINAYETGIIPIKAHGSSTGFQALDNYETDLTMSSRRIKDSEVALLDARYGNLKTKAAEHIVGMDGLAVIVHPSNPISSLSTEQLAQLFSGSVSNWSQMGGPDLAVKIFARDSNSGTWDSFKSMVLKKHDAKLTESATRIESSMELSESVSRDPAAIGFIGLPYVLRAKALAVADQVGGQAIFPTSFTVSTEDYPLSRRLYLYEPSTIDVNSDAHNFIRFSLSEAGQDVVKKAGFISQNLYKTKPVLSQELPKPYLDKVADAERLSLNFRFHSGTFQLDNKAYRDLDRVIDFFGRNPGQSAVLIGFSDSIGDPNANLALSVERARAVEKLLTARGINVQQVTGMGENAPIASNMTKVGRSKNRRVEIWVNGGNSINTASNSKAITSNATPSQLNTAATP